MTLDDFPDNEYIFHGSANLFDVAKPQRSVRTKRNKKGVSEVIFDEISFHATPYKWIAIAYTFDSRATYPLNGRNAYYGMGVNLYEHVLNVGIFGFESLEKSLEKVYADGGYLYVFDKAKFFHTKGLANLEMITKEELKPIQIIKIEDPVQELKKLGVSFNFIDLAEPENESSRAYQTS